MAKIKKVEEAIKTSGPDVEDLGEAITNPGPIADESKEEKTDTITLDTLSYDASFEYDGKVYSRKRMTVSGIVCLGSKGDTLIYLPGNTVVLPL